MSARVLVVDDNEANVRLLQAKLTAEYFDVITATRGEEALTKVRHERPDIVLLDVMMPGMDGFEACRQLKEGIDTRHIPVILITALNQREDRLRGLSAGADDFLTKPIDNVQLLARVKSLARLKVVIDELRSREANGARLGVIDAEQRSDAIEAKARAPAQVLIVDDNDNQARRIAQALEGEHACARYDAPATHFTGGPDLLIVSLAARTFDGFRVIAKMRSGQPTRHLPILAVTDAGEPERMLRALDLGAHDFILRPVDTEELAARVRTLVRRKRYMDALRETLDQGLELAVTDQLTGLFNRRFLMTQLEPLVLRASCGGDQVAVMICDIDHFKRVNDTYGHDVGDEVLREFAARMGSNVRPNDFACRMGGEEFAVVMTKTSGDVACLAGERLRRLVAGAPFIVAGGRERLDVTVSIGVAATEGRDETAESLLKRADEALYQAKRGGRNRVVGRRPVRAA
ncbi:MAG: PleD family two-component system response regulator [Alphaproteobacteria bacterium]|nr:PleD family two-component system response regulator [Alphaproteobacteria bacterium]